MDRHGAPARPIAARGPGAGRRAAARPPRRPLHRAWLAIAPVAAFAASLGVTYRPAPRSLAFGGPYASTGAASCSHGNAWLRIDRDRVTGTAVSDLGQTFQLVGTHRPSGAVFGAISLGDHPIAWFEGEITGGRLRGAIADPVSHCPGNFELTRQP